jgi:hypothetical protein
MYLAWPLCIAAKAQLLSIKNPIQKINPNSTSATSEGSLCASLRVLESMLKSLKVDTPYSNETLEEIRLALEVEGNSSPNWSDMLMERTTSSTSAGGFTF